MGYLLIRVFFRQMQKMLLVTVYADFEPFNMPDFIEKKIENCFLYSKLPSWGNDDYFWKLYLS